MAKTLSAWEARRQFGKVLREVARDGDSFIVESHGEPVAAVVPLKILDSWERERQAFFDDMRATAERANLSEEEAERIVAAAIERVRAEDRSRAPR
ncbi:MAG TPA: type II toxin-antitoxin system Phd/YefM family antitoxin [Thermomicrobiales bacterium]|jgi:prevent-host-death family protein